ncbi:MAG: hypothetical protein KAJ36_01260 [Candidatus Thorarchaeota archaeon]|nr:hypothetical protein [Candidatus Thorarchaeota archaeon]
MAAEDNNQALKEITEKVDTLTKELANVSKELKDVKSALSPVSKIDDLVSSVNEIKKFDKKLDSLATSGDSEVATKKMDELATSLKGFEDDFQFLKDAKETEVILKKIDDILLSLTDSDVIGKKLDDLQGYVAGLSGIEEKVQDLSGQFIETNEIVGIIVRQLDDIERKYNLTIEKLNETVELVSQIVESGAQDPSAKTASKKTSKTTETKEAPDKKKPPVSKASLPSAIDALMDKLLQLVNPQTEAKIMAESLEEIRDELTTMITVHTPILHKLGTKARELKSYPPTATLNENDIASLNKDIKSWTTKLKEIAKSS